MSNARTAPARIATNYNGIVIRVMRAIMGRNASRAARRMSGAAKGADNGCGQGMDWSTLRHGVVGLEVKV